MTTGTSKNFLNNKKIVFFPYFVKMATTYTWNGGSGIWSSTTSWTPNGTPGANDDIIINSAEPIKLTLDAVTNINSLSVSGGSIISIEGLFTLSLKSSLTFAGGTKIKLSSSYPSNLSLGNGSTAFNLVGNDANNYITNNGKNTGYFSVNTTPTSTINLYVDPEVQWFGMMVRKGTLVLKSDCKIDRLILSDLKGQILKVDANKTLTLTAIGTSTLAATETAGGTIDASATGCKVAITGTFDLTNKLLFKPDTKVSSLEYNKAGGTLTLGQAITVDRLLLTNGTINNSNFNITIAKKGTITRGAGTTTVEPIQ